MREKFLQIFYNHYKQISRFAVVGGINTAIDFSVFSLLFYIFGVHEIIANTLSFLLAATNSFFLNALWTFKGLKPGKIRVQILKFFTVSCTGLIVSNTVLYFASFYMFMIFAKVLASFVTMFWNYCASWLFVFKERS